MTDREALQRVMQILGPSVPDVDYTDKYNAMGLIADVEEALSVLRAAGITFHKRPPRSTHARD
jgi:hypothetical protein